MIMVYERSQVSTESTITWDLYLLLTRGRREKGLVSKKLTLNLDDKLGSELGEMQDQEG
jgi:hypothetical protein